MEVKNRSELGHIIKSRRRELCVTQKDLAEKIQISNSYLSDIEVGRINPSLKTLLKILDILRHKMIVQS